MKKDKYTYNGLHMRGSKVYFGNVLIADSVKKLDRKKKEK